MGNLGISLTCGKFTSNPGSLYPLHNPGKPCAAKYFFSEKKKNSTRWWFPEKLEVTFFQPLKWVTWHSPFLKRVTSRIARQISFCVDVLVGGQNFERISHFGCWLFEDKLEFLEQSKKNTSCLGTCIATPRYEIPVFGPPILPAVTPDLLGSIALAVAIGRTFQHLQGSQPSHKGKGINITSQVIVGCTPAPTYLYGKSL